MNLGEVFAEPLVDLGDSDPAFAGIVTPRSALGAVKVGVTAQFLDHAEEYHRRYHDVDYWRFLIGNALEKAAITGEVGTVIDIGSGSGNSVIPLSERFPRARIVATDISPQLLAILRQFLRQRPEMLQRISPTPIRLRREIGRNAWIQDHLSMGQQFGEYWVTSEFTYRSKYCAADGRSSSSHSKPVMRSSSSSMSASSRKRRKTSATGTRCVFSHEWSPIINCDRGPSPTLCSATSTTNGCSRAAISSGFEPSRVGASSSAIHSMFAQPRCATRRRCISSWARSFLPRRFPRGRGRSSTQPMQDSPTICAANGRLKAPSCFVANARNLAER